MAPRISAIAAIGKNRELGKDNDLLWHIPEDMAHFRKTTKGAPVIMGRKTWQSLPENTQPLPGRINIVITRDKDYKTQGSIVVHSLDEAISVAKKESPEEIFIIGGAQIYMQALKITDRLYLTVVDAQDARADVFFPQYAEIFTKELSRGDHNNGKNNFSFIILEK